MSIVQDVMSFWKGLSRRERRWLLNESMRSNDSGVRMRCKIVRNLARGESPARMATILGCGRSHVYRVAKRFLEHPSKSDQQHAPKCNRGRQ